MIRSCEASTLPLSYTPKYLAFQLGREGNRTLDISQQRNLNVNFRYNRGASCLGAQGAKELSAAAKSSMQAAAGAGVLSVGTLGGLLFTQALTGTGIVAASGLAVAGLAVVPWRRKAAREDMANRFDVLKTSIDAAVQGQVDSQVHTAGVSIMDGIAPYSRFVRIEQQRLADMREELGRVREDIFALQAKIKGEL